MLKAKYFPNCSFLELRLGNLPSYTWQSIWASRGLLERGLCWRVGKGDKIVVARDAWIPGAMNYKVNTVLNGDNFSTVSYFIDSLTRSWKYELL